MTHRLGKLSRLVAPLAFLAACASHPESCTRFADGLANLKRTPREGHATMRVVEDGLDCACEDRKRFREVAVSVLDQTDRFAVWTTIEHDRVACAGELVLGIASLLTLDPEYQGTG